MPFKLQSADTDWPGDKTRSTDRTHGVEVSLTVYFKWNTCTLYDGSVPYQNSEARLVLVLYKAWL